MAIIKSQFVFHKNNPPVSILKKSINTGSLSGLLEIKERSRELNAVQSNFGDVEKSIIKEELIINDFYDDYDPEISSYFQSENDQQKSYNGMKGNTVNELPSSHNNKVIEINISDNEDENPWEITKEVENDSFMQSTAHSNGKENLEISDDSINNHDHLKENLEITLESDEEYVMYDFTNFTADDILKAVQNNKLTEEKDLFNVKITKTKKNNENSSNREKMNIKWATARNLRVETNEISREVETCVRISRSSSTSLSEINDEVMNNVELSEKESNSSTETNTLKAIDDVSKDFEKNSDINKNFTHSDLAVRHCVKCRMVLPENYLLNKCSSCQSMLSELNKQIFKNKKRFPCILCSRVFISKYSLNEHLKLKACTGRSRYSCADCLFETSHTQVFANHMMQHHAKKSLFKCQSCHRIFKSLHWLQTHQNLHCTVKRRTFCCAHCSYKCYKRKKIEDHLRCIHVQVYTGKKLQCIKCGTQWSNIFKFNDHIGTCSGKYQIEIVKQKLMTINQGD